jgi:CRP-like cAMP-binding protein
MELTISFQDIAEMTAMTRDSVVRVMKDLSTEKLIKLDENTLTILNFDKLIQLSELG